MTANGSTMVKNIGVLMLMTSTVPTTCRQHFAQKSKVRGITESTVSISLPKRFTIRPVGVRSKKTIGDCSIRASSPKWRLRLALIPPLAKTTEPRNTQRPGRKRRKKDNSCYFRCYYKQKYSVLFVNPFIPGDLLD